MTSATKIGTQIQFPTHAARVEPGMDGSLMAAHRANPLKLPKTTAAPIHTAR